MLEYEDEDERMRRAFDVAAENVGSGSSDLPVEGLDLEGVRALARQKMLEDEQIPVVAPTRRPLRPAPEVATATPDAAPVERVVQTGQPNPDEFELAWARAEDRRARNRQRNELGARQLIAGLTRTQVQPVGALPPSELQRVMARRQMDRSADAQRAGLGLQRERFEYDKSEDARRAGVDATNRELARTRQEALDKRAAEEKDEDQTIRREGIDAQRLNAEAMRGIANANLGMRRDEAARKARDDEEKRAALSVNLFGAPIQLSPGLGESERNKAREVVGLWNAADTATGELEKALEAFVANPSRETAAAANSVVAAASTALNTAYGQGAMAEAEAARMKDTLGADLGSLTGIEAAIKGAFGSPDAGRLMLAKLRTARGANRQSAKSRLGAYQSVDAPPAPRQMSAEDKQAMDWAKANPKDPRAAKILQRLGGG